MNSIQDAYNYGMDNLIASIIEMIRFQKCIQEMFGYFLLSTWSIAETSKLLTKITQ